MIDVVRLAVGRLPCWLALTSALALNAAAATNELNASRVEEIARWLAPGPAGPGRPAADRAAWEALAARPDFAAVVTNAAALARQEVPALPDELFLDYSLTGNRVRCQRVLGQRDSRLSTLALAECLEYRGRFIAPLVATVEALCKERTWVMPAHDRSLKNFHGQEKEMDLRATLVAWDLATVDYLLGSKLPAATRKLIREHVRGRVLQPFREMIEGRRSQISWLRATHNWNAVCLAGVTGAALALEDSPADRAWYIAAAEHYIRYFLTGFTPDGYCSEGMGYWNYGFGRFLMLGEGIRQATGGRLDLLADPAALQPALYSIHAEIINGLYPTIADCSPGSRPDPQLAEFIRRRLGLELTPGAKAADLVEPPRSLGPALMFCFLPQPLPVVSRPPLAAESPVRTWFKDGGVLICRPGSGAGPQFAAVLKGGHNAEHHNHNDVGSFSVVLGRKMVLCDPGAEVYTARTFSSRRYESKVLNSFGHAVPVIAGQLQRTGPAARAVVLRTDFSDGQDTLALDLRSAYAVPGLEKLERTFVFKRGGAPGLEVRDEATFALPATFETALITWGRYEQLAEGELLFTDGESSVKVSIDTGGQPFKLSWEKLDEDVQSPAKPMRLGIVLKSPVRTAAVTLRITPAAGRPGRAPAAR